MISSWTLRCSRSAAEVTHIQYIVHPDVRHDGSGWRPSGLLCLVPPSCSRPILSDHAHVAYMRMPWVVSSCMSTRIMRAPVAHAHGVVRAVQYLFSSVRTTLCSLKSMTEWGVLHTELGVLQSTSSPGDGVMIDGSLL